MSGFHTATICADCDPPVVAISTGHGSRCPRCGQVEAWSSLTTDALDTRLDGPLARQILADMAIRSDSDARLLSELAGRLLDRAGKRSGQEAHEEAGEEAAIINGGLDECPHCQAGEPSVWDDTLFHYAHPAGSKLRVCLSPWRSRCLRCSVDVEAAVEFCAQHDGTTEIVEARQPTKDDTAPHEDMLKTKILVEEVALRIHGTASMHRMGPSGRSLIGEGLAALLGVWQDDRSMRVTMTISWLDTYGIDLEVSREVWSRCLDVDYLHGAEPLGEIIVHVDGEATEWEVRPNGRWSVAQDHGALRVVDTGTVFRVTLALRLGTALEMDISREEWSRMFAESSGRLIADRVSRWPVDKGHV